VTPLRRLGLWAPPLLLMAMIFFFSAQSDLDSGLGVVDLIGRKLIHFAEYALLAFLWWRPLRQHMSTRNAALAAFLVTTAYAASDELHQSFVEGRNGNPIDWAIDSAGAALVCLRLARRRGRSEARG
jgi:VanZ family protein